MSATNAPSNPNDIIGVTRGFLDSQNMMLIILAGLACAFFAILAIFVYVQYRTPKESKDLKRASNQGKMALLTVGVDNFADIMPMNDLIPEGVKESEAIGRGAKKSWLRYKLPKAEQAPEDLQVDTANGKSKELSTKVLQTLLNLNNEKVFLRKAKIPLLVGVKNSVAAVSLKFLGVQSFLNRVERVQKGGPLWKQIQALKAIPEFSELGNWLDEWSMQISFIDFPAVYSRAASTVGQTDIDSIRERDQTIGRREGKEDKDKGTKQMLLYFGFAMGMVAVVIAVVYFFSK